MLQLEIRTTRGRVALKSLVLHNAGYLELVFTETDELPLIRHGNLSYAKQKSGHRDETEGGPHNPRRVVSNRPFSHSPQEGPTAHTSSVSFQQTESFFISLAHQRIAQLFKYTLRHN